MGRLTFLSLGFVAAALALAARAELPDGVNLRSQGPNSSSCRGTQTNEAISVVVDEYTLTTTFSCSAELAALVPSYTPSTPLETCHVQQDWSGQPTQISQAFGIKEGTLTKGEKPQNDYTLSLSSMPSDRAKKIYYKCKPTADDSKNCIVTVSLPAAPKSNHCTLNKTVELTVEKAGKVEFVCPNSTDFQPGNGKVYKAANGSATDELTNVLPGAELNVQKDTNTYTLNVPTLPSTAQTVYFKCVYQQPEGYDDSLSKDCVVKVAVNGAPAGGNTTSTTLTTTSGSAAVASAFSALAVTIAFIANSLGAS